MKQFEAVIEVMKANGGFATLGNLYSEALKVQDVQWKSKTPFASIRRIVQDPRFFFKIRPGLWALNDYKRKLPQSIAPTEKESKKTEYTHSYYQGLLLEIGNLMKYNTFVPNQDKNKMFLEKRLSTLATLDKIYSFTYDHLVRRAQTIDVVWFNDRRMPAFFFEVEHSTDIQNSLLKYFELQDFNVQFLIVADKNRKREYQSKISLGAFKPISERVKFMDYDTVSKFHSRTVEDALTPQLNLTWNNL